ncbi:conserved hypothetical protein [delta proteobacterium NaphS2]|nr:conserved hypothetical protein [delta proteobacterium NaphS2]
MKGLDLCKRFFSVYGLTMIREEFPRYEHRIAAGLVGEGSECYGFDDEISRDHDWGPGFCLWLVKEDYQTVGQALQRRYDQLPRRFEGYERSTGFGHRVGVFEVGDFFAQFIGLSRSPQTLEDWLFLPEAALSKCTNGSVFMDTFGAFSEIRENLLQFYPEDVRLAKMAARCMTAAQAGQYNYMRSVRRNEYYAARCAETMFCSDILSLVFLLNKSYAPYYKWRHRAVAALPILGGFIHNRISTLLDAGSFKVKTNIIEEICVAIIEEFRREGLTELRSDFLLDHGPVIHDKITDEQLRKRDVWIG